MMRALFLAALLLAAAPALAHDHYGSWRMLDGRSSCCNQTDCMPVPYQIRRDGLYLRIWQHWWRANPAEAKEQPAIDGQAHACWAQHNPDVTRPWCYAPPILGS